MAGVTDLPFRMIARSFGCEFAFTEMISARALVYSNKSTQDMLSSGPTDRPLGVQFVGNDPEVLKEAIALLDDYEHSILDLNAACPVSKVAGKGEGSGLLKDPHKLRDLLRVMVDNSQRPVTVKIRSGWDEGSVNAREVALYAQDAGIKALFIHGRTREQGYSGKVDYQVIREVKEALAIPVIASGDALSPMLIKKLFDETGCDGVAIARGSLGNPWIFREAVEYLKSGTIPPRPTVDEVTATIMSHLDLNVAYYGEATGVVVFRKLFAWYTKGLPGAKHLKAKAFLAKTKEQMTAIINELSVEKKAP